MDSKKEYYTKKIIIRKINKKPIGEKQCYASCGPIYWRVDKGEQLWEK